MMRMFFNELGREINVVGGRTVCEWMVVVLGLNSVANGPMIDAVKKFLKKMWHIRFRK